MSRLHGLVLAAIASLVAGCVIPVPIPAKDESVVYGRAFGDDEVRAMMSNAESAEAIRSKLGAPMVDFGPRRVFVYGWTVQKGSVAWAAAWPYGGAAAGTEPSLQSRLLIVAFDQDGKVLKSGTVDYSSFHSMSGQVRRWLAANGLAGQVTSPRPDLAVQSGRMLFVYRPSSSACSSPLFDSSFFKLTIPLYDSSFFKLMITVDGQAVGDVPKGAYLASEIRPSAHVIVIQSYADYFSGTGPKGTCFGCASSGGGTTYLQTTLNIAAEPEETAYIEASVCTGSGDVQVQAAVRSAEVALKAMRGLQPAW